MFSTTFDRPVGAAADVKELEYITALHQTCDEDEDAFLDGSIEAKDLKYFLMSRYGMKVSVDQIQNLIFRHLAGGSGDNECLDICEIVAILLIPFFAKTAKGDLTSMAVDNDMSIQRAFSNAEQRRKYIEDIEYCHTLFVKDKAVEHVLSIILADATGTTDPQPITKELIMTIFGQYGEAGLLHDEDLIEEMINDVSDGDPHAMLDTKSFTRALTKDILLYDVEKESRVSTFYEDVFGMEGEDEFDDDRSCDQHDGDDESDPLHSDWKDVEIANDAARFAINKPFENVFTFSQVDFMADGMRSKTHLTVVYLSFVFAVYAYSNLDEVTICGKDQTTFGAFLCGIGGSVIQFLVIMLMMIAIGVPWILLLTAGNSLRGGSTKNIIYGLIGVVVFTVSPIIFHIKVPYVLDNWAAEANLFEEMFLKILQIVIAVVLFVIQLKNLIRVLMPSLKHSKSRWTSFLFTRGAIRETFLLKLSATLKTHHMVKNALDLHFDGNRLSIIDGEPTRPSSNAHALLNYSEVSDKTEVVGGLFWCWKSYFNRSLLHKEGVMINSRLVLASTLQFFLVIILSIHLPSVLLTTVGPALFPTLNHEVKKCDQSTFDPDKCYFPGIGRIPSGMALCYDVRLEDESCVSQQYFDQLVGSYSESDDTSIGILCDEMSNLLSEADSTIWPLIYPLKGQEEFVQASTKVVNALLCQGLHSFNETLWSVFQDATDTDADSIPCEVPKDSFCGVEVAQQSTGDNFENAMDLLLTAYEAQYKDTMQHLVPCLVQYNSTVINDVFESATYELQETLQTSAQSSWNALFGTVDQALSDKYNLFHSINDFIGEKISSDVADKFDSVFNYTGIVKEIPIPTIPSDYDAFKLQVASTALIDSVFMELDNTLTSVMLAYNSNLALLPSYLSLPNIGIDNICEDIWTVKSNATLLVEAVGSSPERYCRAHVTACSRTGICLIGLDKIRQGSIDFYFPFQFVGKKCDDHPKTLQVIQAKTKLSYVERFIPDLWMINVAIVFAVLLSFSTLLGITAIFIPNAILTALKYRSGVLPSLQNKNFKNYRRGLVRLTFLVPMVFWSALVMTTLVFFLVVLLVFLLLWRAALNLILYATALLIGVGITVFIKFIIVYLLGKYNYAGFYRRRPAVVNVSSIALECWHVFLSLGYVIARFGTLLFVSLLFIGRLDRPILADDLEIDGYPHVFRQVILAHEAHRHPYIERLGMIYMMKLRHGDKFGKRSSSTWRLLFVFALMPWLRKYRITDDAVEIDEDKVREAFALVKQRYDENQELKQKIAGLEDRLQSQTNYDNNISVSLDEFQRLSYVASSDTQNS